MNLKQKLTELVKEHGLTDVLFHLSELVYDIKNKTTINIAALKLGDIGYALKQQAQAATDKDMLVMFEGLYGKPKVRLVVYDFSRDTNREYKFTIAIRTPENAPEAITLREVQELDRAHADLKLTELRKRYDVVEVIDLEWFPPGYFAPLPDNE
jgi:hypothetical protein